MRTSFGPLLTVSDHHCPCGRPVDEDGACARCAPSCRSCGSTPAESDDTLCVACRHAVEVHGATVTDAYMVECDGGASGCSAEATEDECRCGEESTDPATGYVDTCPLHPAAVPVPDALARLSASLCLCSSSDLDTNATACRVHGKA